MSHPGRVKEPAKFGLFRFGHAQFGKVITDKADPAKFGHMRFDAFRFGVTKPLFNTLTQNIIESLPKHAETTPAVFGKMRFGYFKFGVKIPMFEELKRKVEEQR